MFLDDSHILVEPEDGACQQERLGHVVEQSRGHIVDAHHLISHERDAAHDEQHRTGVLRDFEARVFHDVRGTRLDHACTTCTEDGGDDVAQDLENGFHGFVHSVVCFLRVDE